MNTHTKTKKKLKCQKLTIYDWSSKNFKFQSKFYSARVIFPCPCAGYMYKIMKYSETTWPNFHQITCWSYCWNGDWEFVQMVMLHRLSCPYMVKNNNIKQFLLQNQDCLNDPFISCNDRIRKMMHICSGYFTQVSEPRPMDPLFVIIPPPPCKLCLFLWVYFFHLVRMSVHYVLVSACLAK